MEVFFIKYRKILLFASVFMFLYFFYEIYDGIQNINLNNKSAGIGTLIDACISLFVAVYFFINVRKANKTFNEENAVRETND
jgi:hypothetical protein